MKSLLLKDLYSIKILGFAAVAFTVTFIGLGGILEREITHFVILLPIGIFSVMIVLFSQFFDAQSKYCEYESTLPYSVFERVAVKYAEIFAVFLINLLVSVIDYKTITPELQELFTDYFSQFLILPLAVLIILSLVMPLAFRFGSIAMSIGVFSSIMLGNFISFIFDPPNAPQEIYTFALPAIGIAIFIASFTVSYAMLKRRDI